MAKYRLSAKERKILLKLGEAILPETSLLPHFDAEVIERIERFFSAEGAPPELPIFFKAMLHLLEAGARARHLRPMSKLPVHKRLAYLRKSWAEAAYPKRVLFRLFSLMVKASYLNNELIFERLGLEYRKPEIADEAPQRWRERILHGGEIEEDMELEAEAVVVGTGAGGAVAAYQLAEKGNAVIMVEQGDHLTRSSFSGRPFEMQRLMYQKNGLISTVGNASILVPVGRVVGGTTTINSGTCFRTPRRALRFWRDELGLTEYTPANMEPYFQTVEAIFNVRPADMKYVGKNGEIIARGAEKLGYSHGPLLRNAADCEGHAACAFGCPSDAKRSTNVSFVPKALESGAQLMCRVRAEEILLDGRRVAGLKAISLDTGKRLTIKAPVVVLSAGTFSTPLMLMKQKICNASGQVGRNLSLHPSTGVYAVMEEEVNPQTSIPQGYMVDEFEEEGLLFEGASFPLDSFSLIFPQIGMEVQEIMRKFKHIATFGAMVCDKSRGRVLPGIGKDPLVVYWLNKQDLATMQRGIEILTKIYLEAGAEKIYSSAHGWKPMRSYADLQSNLKLKLSAKDIDISAYHPLGSCHMSGHPGRSVCNPNGETYEIDNLFIADGSVIPPSLGVNPQVTIASVAARIGDFISHRLSNISQV